MTIDLAKIEFMDDGARVLVQATPDETIGIIASNVRSAPTGTHAKITFMYKNRSPGYDTFNVGRGTDQRSLVKQVVKQLKGTALDPVYGEISMLGDLNEFCRYLDEDYQADKVKVTRFDPQVIYTPARIVLEPYIVYNGGTAFYAPGGGGKSYMLHIMAAAITNDDGRIWRVVQSDVLYINLERSLESFGWRDMRIRQIMGYDDTKIDFLHARGLSMPHILDAARRFVKDRDNPVVFLDSISRGANGSLNDDQTANRFINEMNALDCTWAAIGHTPAADSEKLYGSTMFVNGLDINVNVESVEVDGIRAQSQTGEPMITRLMKLKMTKANDQGRGDEFYLALDFGISPLDGLIDIRESVSEEWPVELLKGKASWPDEALQIVEDSDMITPTELRNELAKRRHKVAASNLNRWLSDSSNIIRIGKIESKPGVFYRAKTAEDEMLENAL